MKRVSEVTNTGQKKLFIDLFCGSSSFKAEAESAGFEYFGVDWKGYDNVNLVQDIEYLDICFFPKDFRDYDNVHIHASPDCTTYSIAAISTHRDNGKPKTDYAAKCDRVNKKVLEFIKDVGMQSGIWCDVTYSIENPRGYLRKMDFMQNLPRHTVWYCQYGDDRAKPTDIWTNLNWTPRPVCHNGNTNCHHQPAPRGSKTGTQGRKGSYERSKIPNELCRELIESIDNPVNIKAFTPQQLSII